jgi:uncharacterized membrane protein YsdA (DUF1294 family)
MQIRPTAAELSRESPRIEMKIVLLSFLGSVLYSTLRYNVFKGVPWSDWPTYILNKAFALTALLLMAICVIRRSKIPGVSNAALMRMTSMFIAIHIILSIYLRASTYYGKFLPEGRVTVAAASSLALGLMAMIAFWTGKSSAQGHSNEQKSRRLATLALVSGVHAALLGYAVWFHPTQWPGMMPPITLISILLGLLAVAFTYAPKSSV